MGRTGSNIHKLPGQALVNHLHYFQIVRENLLVIRPMSVLTHQLSVNTDVKGTVSCGNQFKLRDTVAHPSQYFACHPDGAKCVSSILAVRDTDFHGLGVLCWIERGRQCVNHDQPPAY
jgi:hypothetical protein